MNIQDLNKIREAALARLAARQSATPRTTISEDAVRGAQSKEEYNSSTAPANAVSIHDASVAAPNITTAFPLLNSSPYKEALARAGISFNNEQLSALEYGLQGKSFCLIGAAGTGKTTTVQTLIKLLQMSDRMVPLQEDTKHLNKGAPGFTVVGFTNKAVNNLKKKLPTHLQNHCLTIHKLIEFMPQYYDVDPDTNDGKGRTMRFEPSRNSQNKLPHISTIILEEASMVGTDLFQQLVDALPNPSKTQIIFLGDLNQLPPIFGPSILGFKLATQPVVELTHVYRQALLSPIIALATAIRTNNAVTKHMIKKPAASWNAIDYDQTHLPWNLTDVQYIDRVEHGKVTLRPWKKRVTEESAIAMINKVLPMMIDSGEYNPDEDMILCPFNKSFGTVELNKIIGQHLATTQDLDVYEVVARYQKSYWCVGDRVLVDRQEGVITKIIPTVGYYGKQPRVASKTMTRWGIDPNQPGDDNRMTADDILNALDKLESGDGDDSKNLASHTITVYFPDRDESENLNSAGSINAMLLAWALTVHKSQGSEWNKVFLFLHNSHSKGTLLSRELLYTAVTRAKKELYIICEGDLGTHVNTLARGAERPVIPGTTLKEKVAYFNSKLKEMPTIA